MDWKAWALAPAEPQGAVSLLVEVSSPPEARPRPPLKLNVLLDKSGSMRGAPLAAAIEAMHALVDRTTVADAVGLLVFDGVVEQRAPLGPMTEKGKRALRSALERVGPGRGTALHAAVTAGANALSRAAVPGARPELLLLTDGEPSVGPRAPAEFREVAEGLVRTGVAIQALGLSRHYVPEILAALTGPSGNGFEHVDGPDGLGVSLDVIAARLFGRAGIDAELRLVPEHLSFFAVRHGYATRQEGGAITVSVGDVAERRLILASGQAETTAWAVSIVGTHLEHGDRRHQRVPLEVVTPTSDRGSRIQSVGLELELVGAEGEAWLAWGQGDRGRALDCAERAAGKVEAMEKLKAPPPELPIGRHRGRIAELRRFLQRGAGDAALLERRALAEHHSTRLSHIIKPRAPKP